MIREKKRVSAALLLAWLLPAKLAAAPSDDARLCLADPPARDALTTEFIAAIDQARRPLLDWLSDSAGGETSDQPAATTVHCGRVLDCDQQQPSAAPANANTAIPAESSTPASAFGSLGQLYHAHLLFAPAAACYRSALQLQPDDYRAHYYLGYLWQQQSQLPKAAAAYQRALQMRPQFPQAALRLALIRIDQGRHREARALLGAWRDHPEFQTWVLFQLGRQALAGKQYRQAIELLKQALSQQPDATRIHYLLAMAWRGLGDHRQARRELALRGDREPLLPDPLVALLNERQENRQTPYRQAMAAINRRDYPTAANAFAAGLQHDPDNLNARISLARALFLSGDVDAAGTQLQHVLAADQDPTPTPALALFLSAILAEHRQQYSQAEALYQRTLEQDPKHAGAHYYLANRLLTRGDYSAAAGHYRAAIEQTPDNNSARLRELLALAYTGAPEAQTLTALRQLHHNYPSDPAIGYYLARLLALAEDPGLRDLTHAERLATTLYQEYPDPNQAELVALVQAAGGHYRSAVQWMDRAIAGARQADPETLTELRRIEQRFRQHTPVNGPPLGPRLIPPPADAGRVFQGYPSRRPY